MSRIVITGGTGFVGRRLVESTGCGGIETVVLTRSPGRARLPGGARPAYWDPSGPGDWTQIIDGALAVVHLAGEPAIGSRWTEAVKRRIRDSRVVSTEQLVHAMRSAKKRPKVFVCASGIGYYGDTGDAVVNEEGAAGSDFLSQVTQAWEAAAGAASEFGVRVVRARLGVVLGRGGGALREMVKPFKLFMGGPIGSGAQYVSWIHLDDAVGAIRHCLENSAVVGAVNVVSPNPVTNAELARGIGAVLERPSAVAVPEFALKVRFGEGAEPLLTGQRALPGVLERTGYVWRYPELRGALQACLG